MNIIWFLIKEGIKGLVRSKYAGAFSVLTIWISLIMVGFGFVAARDMLFVVNNIKSQFDIDIFIHKSTSETKIKEFESKLRQMPEIQDIQYISSDAAAEKFKKEFGEDIFEVLDYNPLPPSFTISLKEIYRNLISVESITTEFSKQDLVDEIKYRKNFLIILEKYQRIFLWTILGVFMFLTIISIILISNSIKMAIFSRREVIFTMKLVGATNNFVRAPFLIEGMLQGFLGACLSVGLIYGVFYLQNNYLQSILEYKAIVDYKYYVGMLILGSFVGLTGSARAIKKFL